MTAKPENPLICRYGYNGKRSTHSICVSNVGIQLSACVCVYLLYISSQLHQQGDSLSHCDPVVDVTALQTCLQFGEVTTGRESLLVTLLLLLITTKYHYSEEFTL